MGRVNNCGLLNGCKFYAKLFLLQQICSTNTRNFPIIFTWLQILHLFYMIFTSIVHKNLISSLFFWKVRCNIHPTSPHVPMLIILMIGLSLLNLIFLNAFHLLVLFVRASKMCCFHISVRETYFGWNIRWHSN